MWRYLVCLVLSGEILFETEIVVFSSRCVAQKYKGKSEVESSCLSLLLSNDEKKYLVFS